MTTPGVRLREVSVKRELSVQPYVPRLEYDVFERYDSLRKLPTFREATTGFPAKGTSK